MGLTGADGTPVVTRVGVAVGIADGRSVEGAADGV